MILKEGEISLREVKFYEYNLNQFPGSGAVGEGRIKNFLMPPEWYKNLRNMLRQYSPLYMDIHDKKGVSLLCSPRGGCTELIRQPLIPTSSETTPTH